MVSWSDICDAIHQNPDRACFVDDLSIPETKVPSERISLKPNTPANAIHAIRPENPVNTVKTDNTVKVANTVKTRTDNTQPIDPIVLGMEHSVELFDGSSKRSKQQMECEEAIRIEGMLNDLYKSQGGRSRGWTKVMLEEMIQPRCASGGNIRDLDKSKKTFVWQLVGDEKVYSSFLDFICVAKKIRVAVWFEDRRVIVYPAADSNIVDESESTYPLIHVTCKGHIEKEKEQYTYASSVQFCDSNNYVLMPPLSVIHSLSGLKLDELESVGKQLGMASVEGTKKERIALIASYKLRQRLLG